MNEKDKHGTVGAVALDQAGDRAAGASTGGTTNKQFGRIGDSPIIGTGTCAINRTCAVACTGDGEYFMRGVAACDLSLKASFPSAESPGERAALTWIKKRKNCLLKFGKLPTLGANQKKAKIEELQQNQS